MDFQHFIYISMVLISVNIIIIYVNCASVWKVRDVGKMSAELNYKRNQIQYLSLGLTGISFNNDPSGWLLNLSSIQHNPLLRNWWHYIYICRIFSLKGVKAPPQGRCFSWSPKFRKKKICHLTQLILTPLILIQLIAKANGSNLNQWTLDITISVP